MYLNVKITRIPAKRGSMPPLPAYATPGSAAMDLFANIDDSVSLGAGESMVVPCGLALGLPSPEYVGLVFMRSGVSLTKSLSLTNGVGVIDSDYTGEIKLALRNNSSSPVIINPLERIAQMMVVTNARVVFEEVDALEATSRGSGGFGSTGV